MSWGFDRFLPVLERIGRYIDGHFEKVTERLDHIMASLQDIQKAVADQTTVEQSVVTLMRTLHDQLKTAIDNQDQAAMQDILTQLQNNTGALSQAVIENTPAAGQGPGGVTPVSGTSAQQTSDALSQAGSGTAANPPPPQAPPYQQPPGNTQQPGGEGPELPPQGTTV